MNIVIAPDSFKESVGAPRAAKALKEGVLRALPDAKCTLIAMSDGGEGFMDAVAASLGARRRCVPTLDCLGRLIDADIASSGSTAIIETSRACGLDLIAPAERSIRDADTRGVGCLILRALDEGAEELLVGIGGSATTDGGAGMLAELGARFLDSEGRELGTTPRELDRVTDVDFGGLDPRLTETKIRVACDVNNPLVGANGAAAIFGPQKGATARDVEFLDGILVKLRDASGRGELAGREGAGAAGGLGFALLLLGAELIGGVDLVADAVGLEEKMSGADLVLTGEGSMDAQTLMGKTPAGVAARARRLGVPVIAFAGRIKDEAKLLLGGFDALVPIVRAPQSLEEALADGEANLAAAGEMAMRLLLIGR